MPAARALSQALDLSNAGRRILSSRKLHRQYRGRSHLVGALAQPGSQAALAGVGLSTEHFVGDTFTVADIQMIYGVQAALDRSRVPGLDNLRAWEARVTGRPAYQRAAEKGGPAIPVSP